MNENDTQKNDTPEESTLESTDTGVQPDQADRYDVAPEEPAKKSRLLGYGAAILAVAVILVGVLYLLEKEGRSSTGIFDSLLEQQDAGVVVAVVNGEEIVNADLATSIGQFSQAATAQGVDTSTPEAQAEIRGQALEVLINTELLRQQANAEGIEVTSEEAAERLAEIEAEIGGAEVLAERMETLGVDTEQLRADIREELLIQRLLDSVFESSDIEVTEEEIEEVYAQAGGAEADLPPLEEVREQIVTQIETSKEQQIIEEYITELRAEAAIETSLE